MQKIIAICFLIIATTVACKKSQHLADKYITLSYKQTYCADPWKTEASDDLTLRNISDYLNEEKLYVAGLTIKQDASPELCNACSCKSGKTIYVSTLNSENIIAGYLQIGFKQ